MTKFVIHTYCCATSELCFLSFYNLYQIEEEVKGLDFCVEIFEKKNHNFLQSTAKKLAKSGFFSAVEKIQSFY